MFEKEFHRPKATRDQDPMEQLLKRNLDRSDMPYLLTALEWGDDNHSEKIIRHINTGNWKSFLARVNKAGAWTIFAHLARSENRKQKDLTKMAISDER